MGLVKPVVVGHSLGGVVALDLASRYPDVPAALVLLDAPVLAPQALAASTSLQGFLVALQTPSYQEAVRGFIGGTFLPTDDPERRARLLDQMSAAQQHVAASVFAQLPGRESEAVRAQELVMTIAQASAT